MKKRLILIILLLIFPVVVNAESKYLYDVLKNEAENNGLAREYTGEHHDSFTQEPTKKIYHWYAENDTAGEQILNKNNVIFGNFCWQMIRTTDTGGIKLIYNGTPTDGKCNNSGANQQIGKTAFNSLNNSPADIGYMSNTRYTTGSKSLTQETIYYETGLSTSYWYADSITWNSSTNKYELVNPYKALYIDTSLNGKYSFFSGSETASNSYVYYIRGVAGRYGYYIPLENGHLLDYYNNNYTYGDSYTDNGNNTYTINNPQTLSRLELYTKYNNLNKKYICKNATNNTCSEVWYTNDLFIDYFNYLKTSNNYKFGKDFIYENNTYTLSNDNVNEWNLYNSIIDNHHYTCFNNTGECDTLSYIILISGSKISYINIPSNKRIEDILSEMLYSNVNVNNSTIKTYLDDWYQNNMTSYDNYLEDTVYCNDRKIKNIGGWNSEGAINSEYIEFTNYQNNNSLKCDNVTDKFSKNNNQAKLNYPVGLLTYPETQLLGQSIIKTGERYWLMSPKHVSNHSGYPSENHVTATGTITGDSVIRQLGVRPVISLKPKSRYSLGDGSKDNPYIFDESSNYSIDVEINNETEDLTVEIDDLSQVPEGETVNFRVTPIKGRKLTSLRIVDEDNNEINYTTTDNKNYTFTMPATDVTIKPTYERVKNAVNVEDNKNTKEFVIEVNDATAVVYEDTVRFKVEPEEGYEVEKIDITDEGNNIISYKKTSNKNEYEFTMPDTDVLIKPYYRLIPTNSSTLINPNTKRQILLIVISVIILSIMTFIYYKKKKK